MYVHERYLGKNNYRNHYESNRSQNNHFKFLSLFSHHTKPNLNILFKAYFDTPLRSENIARTKCSKTLTK